MKTKWLLTAILILAFCLRVFHLDYVPPSLYWDEASLGYNAFSIAETLHDEHGEFLPVTRFIAFGDYKAPGYIYADAAVIKLLGLSDFTVRLPSALAGTLLVLFGFLLAKELTDQDKVGLLTAFLVAVSPWAIQFSRGAFEANLATLLCAAGAYFFLRALRSPNFILYLLSSVFFVGSMYTFNSHKIFVPLLIIALTLIFYREVLASWRKYLLFGVVSFLLVLPLLLYSRTREAQLRFEEVSWLNDLAPIELSNQRIAVDGHTWWSDLLHNRRVVYSLEFIQHYTDTFRADFLFYSGDVNNRLSIQTVGEMYWWELPFLLAGLFFVVKRHDKTTAILFSWLLLAPIPAAVARETPHALRTLNMLPIPQIFVAIGLFELGKALRRWRYLLLPVVFLALMFYLHDYYFVYPVTASAGWQYGYKQMVDYVSSVEKNYSCVNVTETYGRPYIYFLLYNHYPPQKYWQTRNVSRDWYGFWYIYGFDKYTFGSANKPGCLLVRAPSETPKNARVLKTIFDPAGHTVFDIYENQ